MHGLRRLAAAACAAFVSAASAQAPADWPHRQIRWIVPYTPGGITDSVTRLLTQRLQEALGQPIVVENKPGANSIVGAELASRSPPDGYTFLTVIAAHAANATLYSSRLPFDPVRSFAPVSLVGISPLILTVNNDFPAKDVMELVSYAKANPGKVSFGSSGVGSATHLTFELLQQTAGVKMLHVPYKGTAPALTAVMAGDIQVLGDVPSSLMQHVRAGKVRALAMFSSRRVSGAAEVPTIVEAGGPAIEGNTWVMFLAPAGTPPAIVQRLSGEVAKIVRSPQTRARFEQLGIEGVGSSPSEAARFLDDEITKWSKVITTAGVKAE